MTAYGPGPSLEEAVNRHGPMPEAMVFRLIAGVAESLAASHAAGVVHRDLKPSNVLLAQDGPRVTGFGIAPTRAATALTGGAVMTGSPDFLAPEQILDLPVTPAVDVFALGSLAVFAAAGRPPFGAGDVMATARRVAYEPPDLSDCPLLLLTLIESCLEKQAKDRPAPSRIIEYCVARGPGTPQAGPPWQDWSPADTAAEAAGAGSAPAPAVTAAGASAGGRVKTARRRPRLVVALAAALALAAATVIAIVVSTQRAPAGDAARRSPAAHSLTSAAAAPAGTRATSLAPGRPLVLLSQNYPVAASSVQGYPWAAANAVDGNLGTRWSSVRSDPQWLAVDLRATHAIRKVVIYWESAYATAFQIQVSADGTTWTDVYATTTGAGGTQSIPVRGTGRYVRMYGTQRSSGYGYSMWEFQVFGP